MELRVNEWYELALDGGGFHYFSKVSCERRIPFDPKEKRGEFADIQRASNESPDSPAEKGMDPPDVVAFLELDGIVFRGPHDAAVQHKDDMILARLLNEALDHRFAFLRFAHHFDDLDEPGPGLDFVVLIIDLYFHG